MDTVKMPNPVIKLIPRQDGVGYTVVFPNGEKYTSSVKPDPSDLQRIQQMLWENRIKAVRDGDTIQYLEVDSEKMEYLISQFRKKFIELSRTANNPKRPNF